MEDVKDLLVEFEKYVVSIGKDNLEQIHPNYREKMTILDLKEVSNNDGKCYMVVEDNKAIGLIMGCIFSYDEYDPDYEQKGCDNHEETNLLSLAK